jgi:hypothetical protein
MITYDERCLLICLQNRGYDISEEDINKQYWIGKQLYDLPLSTKLKYKPEDLELGELLLMT